jgi:hypothetical protein
MRVLDKPGNPSECISFDCRQSSSERTLTPEGLAAKEKADRLKAELAEAQRAVAMESPQPARYFSPSEISFDEYKSFRKDLLDEIAANPRLYHFNCIDLADGALIVSFDQFWKPFFGMKQGYNPMEFRVYVKCGSGFFEKLIPRVKELRAEFLEIRHEGGRVFLGAQAIWRKDRRMDPVIAIDFAGGTFS